MSHFWNVSIVANKKERNNPPVPVRFFFFLSLFWNWTIFFFFRNTTALKMPLRRVDWTFDWQCCQTRKYIWKSTPTETPSVFILVNINQATQYVTYIVPAFYLKRAADIFSFFRFSFADTTQSKCKIFMYCLSGVSHTTNKHWLRDSAWKSRREHLTDATLFSQCPPLLLYYNNVHLIHTKIKAGMSKDQACDVWLWINRN